MTTAATEPLALYVHWPFCVSKCPYCDFNSHVREKIDGPRWERALLTELEDEARRLGPRPLGSIFFGGGTPSLMDPATTARIIERARALFPAESPPEISLEANPTTVESARLRDFRAAGVERLSIGVQALDEAALKALGRAHGLAEALDAIGQAREIFPRMSFDLIYARPGQTMAAWMAELDRAVDLAADHLSLYQLTIEPGTAFHTRHARGELVLPEDDEAADLYEATTARLAAAGLPAYEVSNHARPGFECRHNLAYWTYADYAGIGPGAHGRVPTGPGGRREATRRARAPETWLDLVDTHGHGRNEAVVVGQARAAEEALMMGLRLDAGIDPVVFERRTGVALRDAVDATRLAQAVEGGFVAGRTDRLVATPAGRLVLGALTAHLLADDLDERFPEARLLPGA
ncbi:MAG: coproporphyrinogen III oxidase [Tistrella sp.]|mgnify:CR=1 FL=1|uniref:Heme chaperone HemW n=1 Tax=Tistrella mobilis TaxID=171437 RepID=A0A3B9IEK1_9PROT|nr:radical SAM family heme chaperone HemW [Tistrella sp.]MAD40486.1 coproporphyrinogen III oxidase [Tistrella sp.]MBA78245.1 coproporphyrinogen III oxidase [Tistrella sp.]HAE46291.1 coproporphyrinogen III oxidase [Tistrella mobilis]